MAEAFIMGEFPSEELEFTNLRRTFYDKSLRLRLKITEPPGITSLVTSKV